MTENQRTDHADNPSPEGRVAKTNSSDATEVTPESSATTLLDSKDAQFYGNRELAILEFNRRVLELAVDESMPLLERLQFLGITSRNLDEYFEIRVAGLQEQASLAPNPPSGTDNAGPQDLLKRIAGTAHALVDEQYRVLNEILLPALEKVRVHILRRSQWTPKIAAWIRQFFESDLLPVLTPMGLDPAHPFPRILNKSLNFIVALKGKDAFGRDSRLAVVQAPRALSRVIRVPPELADDGDQFVLLSSIIHAHVGELFAGMEAMGCYQFRVTRNSDLFVDPEEVDDVLHAIQGELNARRFGEAVRLEVADNCPREIADFLLRQFQLDPDDLYQVNGLVNLTRLMAIYDLVDRPDLKFSPFNPGVPSRIEGSTDLLQDIQQGDILLMHPFESFIPVVDLVRQAAADPNVLAIKQTLYRTGPDSPIVKALIDAAKAGKEVTVVIELQARFDEEANIQLANQLQYVGAHVVYGVVGYKTHAKMILIVRREGRKLRRYVHLGTGNYHTRTSRQYTDYSFFSCDQEIGEDVHNVFLQLTGLGKASKLKRLLQAPFTLHKKVLELIRFEKEQALQGKPARIIAKMNSLIEPLVIEALYEASQAGVKIDLIVRGMCTLRPGIPGLSEHIHVRSILGRFLEHSRIYHFYHAGAEHTYLSSADWMGRNFLRRVEIAFPILDPVLKERVMKEGLQPYLNDNSDAWIQQSDGTYKRIRPGNQKPRSAQSQLLQKLAGT